MMHCIIILRNVWVIDRGGIMEGQIEIFCDLVKSLELIRQYNLIGDQFESDRCYTTYLINKRNLNDEKLIRIIDKLENNISYVSSEIIISKLEEFYDFVVDNTHDYSLILYKIITTMDFLDVRFYYEFLSGFSYIKIPKVMSFSLFCDVLYRYTKEYCGSDIICERFIKVMKKIINEIYYYCKDNVSQKTINEFLDIRVENKKIEALFFDTKNNYSIYNVANERKKMYSSILNLCFYFESYDNGIKFYNENMDLFSERDLFHAFYQSYVKKINQNGHDNEVYLDLSKISNDAFSFLDYRILNMDNSLVDDLRIASKLVLELFNDYGKEVISLSYEKRDNILFINGAISEEDLNKVRYIYENVTDETYDLDYKTLYDICNKFLLEFKDVGLKYINSKQLNIVLSLIYDYKFCVSDAFNSLYKYRGKILEAFENERKRRVDSYLSNSLNNYYKSELSEEDKKDIIINFFADGVKAYNNDNRKYNIAYYERLFNKIKDNERVVGQIISGEKLIKQILSLDFDISFINDYTLFVVNQIKAVEIFLKSAICKHLVGETISDKNNNVVIYKNTKVEDLSKFELGSIPIILQKYCDFSYESKIFEYYVDRSIFAYDKKSGDNIFHKEFISKVRNGYFHSHEISTLEKCKEIRCQTAYWFIKCIDEIKKI